ncbi:MAG: DUF3536 domain-containing protein [Candidatus Omnitrophica bacterium]|nr:DUF3536 domain-containing protein [Candidatus Omnitrophota bacterium]
MKKHITIHGHFYQPPRENPWTGEVEREDSAAPDHDWNERITKECYAPNTRAPVLDPKGQTKERVNNFSYLSFDIGPTLLSWLRKKNPAVYEAILDADRRSISERGGHGNAMAQVYNHVIMPLASRRDKITQVIWGIRDFEFHYKRKPEGMWLSETAADKETLNVMAEHGILFTVLAPHQAKRVRRLGFGSEWQNRRHETVDTRQAYRMVLDHGRQFHVFFYDAPLSRAIAFQGLLHNGDELVYKLLTSFSHRQAEQLVSTATDGESFGHHHRFGEMAIAYGFKKIRDYHLAHLVNFAEFLAKAGSQSEADIHENSSWSCAHGVERWRSDCGCHVASHEGWNQKWRAPLRDAFDFLKKIVDDVYETQAGGLLKDPWGARNDYIEVMLDGSEEGREKFLARQAGKNLNPGEETKLWNLLEAEKFALFMFTSCGWFFDELSGIEPVQNMKFAARAAELVQPYVPDEIEPPFLKILADAKSNLPEMGTGADIYKKVRSWKLEVGIK